MSMKLWIEAVVLCTAFFAYIALFVCRDRRDGLQWYPKAVQAAAVQRGVISQSKLNKQRKISMLLMVLISAIIILGSVFFVNRVSSWRSAFGQIYFLCFVLNCFDGIVVDYIWIRKTNYWIIPELSDFDIPKPLNYLIKERVIAALVYIPLAALLGCITFVL